ncbi:small basic family protein [Candidatus Gracilibacteria bacterium]|nr:small basic family protein [Candidatus Gracilibacteria bacterium]
MPWAIIGILVGIIIGFGIDTTIPIEYIKYSAVSIIGILDALFGAAKAQATKEEYNTTIFLTGLVFNVLLALGITYIGEKLGLDLYLAVTVVFTFRIFSNFGQLRRAFLEKHLKTKI